MHFVYILQSQKDKSQFYIGHTHAVSHRLDEHNQGKSIYTNKYKPWLLVSYVAFVNKNQAIKFEKYLKSGSGHAFFNKHLVSQNLKPEIS